MTHKCLRCGAVYEDNDPRVLKGCKCGSVFFMFFKSTEDLQRIESIEKKLSQQKTSLEKELSRKIKEVPIETVKSPKDGVYEINIEALMNKKPLIIMEKEGVYFIHLPSVFDVIIH
jgi:hypothetical protein